MFATICVYAAVVLASIERVCAITLPYSFYATLIFVAIRHVVFVATKKATKQDLGVFLQVQHNSLLNVFVGVSC